MKKIIITFIILITAILVLVIIVPKTSALPDKSIQHNTIVLIGDSLTYGTWPVGTPTKNLIQRLSEKYPDDTFINLGINGVNTFNIDNRKTDADQYHPNRVVVWGGINDIAGKDVLSETTEIEANLKSIYTYYHDKNYEVWAITITPNDANNDKAIIIRDNLNSWIKNESNEYGVDKVIDAFTLIADPKNTNIRLKSLADPNTPNHINDAGFATIVEQM